MSKIEQKTICGIVMPISETDGCSENHWSDVLTILTEAIEDIDYEARLVSSADEVGVIHKRIVQNLYDNPIVVCDISARNPNVMFELGLRLAFDKPTIIIKDDKTPYSFDTGQIEHLEYPRDLRFGSIVDFKSSLKSKIKNTIAKHKDDPDFSTFLGHFGTFKVAKLDSKEVSGDEFIIDELKEIKRELSGIRSRNVSIASEARSHPFTHNLGNGDIIEFTKLAKRYLRKYMKENRLTVSDLIDQPDRLFHELVGELHPYELFPESDDFRQFIKFLIGSL